MHRGKVVAVVLENTQLRVLFEGKLLSAHSRTTVKEVNGLRVSGHIDYEIQARCKASADAKPSNIN
ncbi:hypothetical protein [Nonomuraea sp. NEAU-A123]|uniref:hypothetical protein n=1 Tax=Nonomuraea sp. NEAU-A123 TaxID=2839649 RepID=UPI001BE4CC5F|nr:hypothetical protein [Nonomuraea sp. NEAU-A123]MBT2231160.1 hypothetical protein [Nonomuraea sp. NEAU-A123]